MNQSTNQNDSPVASVDYWQVIKNRCWIILLTLTLVFLISCVLTYMMKDQYESTAVIEIRSKMPAIDLVNFSDAGKAQQARTFSPRFFDTEFEKIKSRNVLIKVVESLNLDNKWSTPSKEVAINILKSKVKTMNRRGSDLIEITVRDESAQDAKEIAQEVTSAYKSYRADLERREIENARREADKIVQTQKDKVEERKNTLDNISKALGVAYSEGTYLSNQNAAGTDMAKQEYYKLQSEMTALTAQINSLLSKNSEELLIAASSMDLPDSVIKNLSLQYLEQKRTVAALRQTGLGPNHPDIVANNEILNSMKKQMDEAVVNLRQALENQLRMAQERLKGMDQLKDARSEEEIKKSIDQQKYRDAKNQYEIDRKVLEGMEVQLLASSISEKLPDDSVVIHDDPIKGDSPVSPNVSLNLILGSIAGLVFGVVIAFALEFMDTSVKSMDDVERYLQVPVLAVVPRDIGVLHKQGDSSLDAEAYRILRTNIEFNRKNPTDNAITVVSGGPSEGKSTTLVNLAYICAQGGYSTLMIDADLRRPRLHTFFDINNSVGLTNYLTTEMTLEEVILQTPVDNLYFMPSGVLPMDAAGILNSRRMSELIQDVKQRFDLVLVDSPPILGVSDASVLASEVDLTMIVVQHRKLPRNMLVRVKKAVESVGGTVVGVVLNNVDVRSDSQYQYYTSYYSYYAPTEGNNAAPVSNTAIASAPKSAEAVKSVENELY